MTTLEQELENQINVHRWRKLEGSNPKAYELIQLQQTLQKKLLEKTREEDQKTRQIAENEEMYLHCKTLLANQVGPEAFEQVKDYEKMLKEKQLQLKHSITLALTAVSTELNMYQAQGKEYKHGIEKLDREISQLKELYIIEYYKSSRRTSRDNIPLNMSLPYLPPKTATERPKTSSSFERASFPSTPVIPPIESNSIVESSEPPLLEEKELLIQEQQSLDINNFIKNNEIEVVERVFSDLQSNTPPVTDNLSLSFLSEVAAQEPVENSSFEIPILQTVDEVVSDAEKVDAEDHRLEAIVPIEETRRSELISENDDGQSHQAKEETTELGTAENTGPESNQ